jgi:hypothetical protein
VPGLVTEISSRNSPIGLQPITILANIIKQLYATLKTSRNAFALPPRTAVDYGDCKSRLILYLKVADGFKGWGFRPTNQKDFQHRASPYFVPIAVFICNRLRNECMGPTETFNAYNSALTFASAGKVGEKADRFNKDIIPDVAPKPEPTPTPPAPEPSKAWRN